MLDCLLGERPTLNTWRTDGKPINKNSSKRNYTDHTGTHAGDGRLMTHTVDAQKLQTEQVFLGEDRT